MAERSPGTVRKLRYLLCVLFAVILALVPAAPALAIDEPDDPPEVPAVFVFEGLLEPGDVGIFVEYFLDYTIAGIPAETVTESFLVVFVDTDGTTQLRTVAPFAFDSKGYGPGIAWMYFTAAEATTLGLNSADQALYRIWLTGNPTLTWVPGPDPPKTISTIDIWHTAGDMNVLLALRVLTEAQTLGTAWALDLIEITSIGNRLTRDGESYFENAIPNLRNLAPAVFSAGTTVPTQEDIDFTTLFGAVVTGTIVVGSPVTLVDGANVISVTGVGDFVAELEQGTVGTVTSGTATVTGSPAAIVAGTNTLTVTATPGPPDTVTIDVTLEDTTTALEDSVIGTGLDLTPLADLWGVSRWLLSGIVWMVVTILIIAGVFKVTPGRFGAASGGKVLLPTLVICLIAGSLLGLLKPLVVVTAFILLTGFFVGYVLLFRGASA
ncbi:MAG: hypothetical protein ACUZ8A_06515 [Candidatus Bathyanammoxibius sp.]